LSLLVTMMGVLAAWIAAASVCLGVGLVLDRALHGDPPDAGRALLSFWLGWGALVLLLTLWSLAAPVTVLTAALAAAAGLGGLAATHRRWPPLLSALRGHPLPLALFAVGVLALVNLSLRPLEHYDTGLYLLGGMGWAREHAALPGLGHLHGRFAFNNAHLLLAALLDAAPVGAPAYRLVNGPLLAAALAQGIVCGRRLLRGQGGAVDAFGLVMLAPAAILVGPYGVSLSSDLPATLLALVVAWRTFRLLAGESRGRERAEVLALCVLTAAAIAVKLSTAVFVGLCWVAAVAASLAARRARGELTGTGPTLRSAAATVLLLGALLAPWLARGALLSGYPLYPGTWISLPVDWRLDPARARREADGIRAWARVPGVPRELVLEGPYWLESWSQRHLRYSLRPGFALPLTLAALGLLAAAAASARGRALAGRRALWLLLPAGAGLGVWFHLAPDPRFGMFLFWSAAATGVGGAVGAWGAPGARTAAVGLAGLSLLAAPRTFLTRLPEGDAAGPRAVATRVFETRSGLRLHVPAEGDQCWDAPRPCTPYPRADLRLRRAGDPASGFVRGPTDPPATARAALRGPGISANSRILPGR
jgi:hypothetical protein